MINGMGSMRLDNTGPGATGVMRGDDQGRKKKHRDGIEAVPQKPDISSMTTLFERAKTHIMCKRNSRFPNSNRTFLRRQQALEEDLQE